ncbi:MAG TPA: Na+/H+ antiporter subunit E [Desulfotignum sp.]|nr:Na+/H+ antiporter subunit E [Desulfotignum sp.]
MAADTSENRETRAGRVSGSAFFSFFITFVFMFATWIILSGKFDPLLLGLGLFSSAVVAWFFHDLLFAGVTMKQAGVFVKFCRYMPWLVMEIIKANFHILYLVFHPRMLQLIDPHIIQFQTGLKSDIAITTLANAITLTPGTVTVTASADGGFKVHAIDRPSAQSLPGAMLDRVVHVYGESR